MLRKYRRRKMKKLRLFIRRASRFYDESAYDRGVPYETAAYFKMAWLHETVGRFLNRDRQLPTIYGTSMVSQLRQEIELT